jgi:hypothetical protein
MPCWSEKVNGVNTASKQESLEGICDLLREVVRREIDSHNGLEGQPFANISVERILRMDARELAVVASDLFVFIATASDNIRRERASLREQISALFARGGELVRREGELRLPEINALSRLDQARALSLSAKNDMELLHADRTVVEGDFANLRHREALLATRESTLEK